MISDQATLTQREEQGWVLPRPDPQSVEQVIRWTRCPLTIAELLVARGIDQLETVLQFLTPSVEHLLDPMHMTGMEAAVTRIQRAVLTGEAILIYGDYDVDGTIATVLLKAVIESIASPATPSRVAYHIPHRLREGYGMQNNVLELAAAAGTTLVISVDTGIRAFSAALEAKRLGIDLIVTDHHVPDEKLGIPEALAVLNPQQPGCSYPFPWLSGAGVAFKLAHALLRKNASSVKASIRLRDHILPSLLKVVAIATIADSVSLTGENRTIAWLGLRELKRPRQAGLCALMEIARLAPGTSPSAADVGFRLAPRINAAGRMNVGSDVVELLSTRDTGRARELAQKLDQMNEDRRAAEALALKEIELDLASLRDSTGRYVQECIILDNANWHRGILGILASRVVEQTGRPALVLSHTDGEAHGSGRSIVGFHLLDALTAVHAAGPHLFTRFGGHSHAVGFSLSSLGVVSLRERMRLHTVTTLTPGVLAAPLRCDAEVRLRDLTPGLYDWLERCAPFGNGHTEPVFIVRGVKLACPVRLIKEKHVRLELRDDDGTVVNALGWSRAAVFWPGRCLELGLREGTRVDAAFRLKKSTYMQSGTIEMELCALRSGVDLSLPA